MANIQDHRTGDKERFKLVAKTYRDMLETLSSLHQETGLKARNPELFHRLEANLRDRIKTPKEFFQSYSHFYNTREDSETEFLFDDGLSLIKAWFEGWYMGHIQDSAPLLRALRAARRLFPNPDMVLYRVVAVEDASKAVKLRILRTGQRDLQSWTLNKRTAKWFFDKQYAGGQTMDVDSEGYISSVNKLDQHDWILVSAKIPGNLILWTPSTADKIENYAARAYDSKLYGTSYRIPDKVSEVLYAYRNEQETIVFIPKNTSIPIMSVTPLHTRASESNGLQESKHCRFTGPMFVFGDRAVYDPLLRQKQLVKSGRSDDYVGGSVFPSIGEARKAMAKHNKIGKYGVYRLARRYIPELVYHNQQTGDYHLTRAVPVAERVYPR